MVPCQLILALSLVLPSSEAVNCCQCLPDAATPLVRERPVNRMVQFTVAFAC
jgi:hypothetical protein